MRVMLKKLIHVIAVVFPLIGSFNSWANPFAWPKEINFVDIADFLSEELKGCKPLDDAVIENYFTTIMAEATALMKKQDFKKESKDQAKDSLDKHVHSTLLALETNPEEQLAVREAFHKKLAEFTEQAKKRAHRIVAVEAAQEKFKIKKASQENKFVVKIANCDVKLGSVELTSGENKQSALLIFTLASGQVNDFIKRIAFDTLSHFDSSLAVVGIYGYHVIPSEGAYSDFYLAYERADHYDFGTYKKLPESVAIFKNKKEVLRNLLALGKALLFAHEHQRYHGAIQLDTVWTAKEWPTWKLFCMPELYQESSSSSTNSNMKDARFQAPELSGLTKPDDNSKTDIFSFAILIEILMLDDNDPLLIAWNKIQPRLVRLAISKGATPFTSYRFAKGATPDLSIAEPHSTLPKKFRDQIAVFAATDPDQRGSLKELVEVLEQAYNNWDTLTEQH